MSCWVVPTIAAELWQVPVENIQARIRDGSIPTRRENGFTFIDVAPDSPPLETIKAVRTPPPPTYRVVTREEIVALVGDMVELDDDGGGSDVGNWRSGRSEASRIRKPPESIAA